MSNTVANYILVIVIFVCLLLIGVEPSQAGTISLLFGIFYTLGDIHYELKGKK